MLLEGDRPSPSRHAERTALFGFISDNPAGIATGQIWSMQLDTDWPRAANMQELTTLVAPERRAR